MVNSLRIVNTAKKLFIYKQEKTITTNKNKRSSRNKRAR
jgi:hypothetical protein